ncbi:glycosyltransferase family 1 protein [Laccaria amethystina LaAM-08-1]|uniref:sterol 3beta-glucosyltransferase n=1 Tax=Laccaria amethystina LaAM-08-1 TaxID=1095629 RepID=A0A0C9X6Z2_9AGAR|nr:glycosyltransferase family 1 protein [Laccaria amethystina LaAM-08-1]
MSVLAKLFSLSSKNKRKNSDAFSLDRGSSIESSHSDEDSTDSPKCPSISRLYNQADAFENVLRCAGCVKPLTFRSKTSKSGFESLVRNDLNQSELEIADHDAKVAATTGSWIPVDLDSGDSVQYDAEDEYRISNDSSPDADLALPAIHRVPNHESEELAKLKPEEIVPILIQEFGELAGPDEEELLLLETDGCLFSEISVVGVIHLTTHRLTFHASLLATRPDLSSSHQVLKAGPATFHRKGWRVKRRLWVELTHDMICSYASSKEEDKTRPLCTTLLSFFHEVLPIDPKHPRFIRFIIKDAAHNADDYVELDTEESAHDWRREINGALSLQRHRRMELYSPSADSEAGVRLSCPLDRIIDFQTHCNADLLHLVSFRVQLTPADCKEDACEGMSESPVIQVGPVQHIPTWDQLEDRIEIAKRRVQNQPPNPQSVFFVDFGPFRFLQRDNVPPEHEGHITHRERAIRAALGFAAESELWFARARIYRTVTSVGYFAISRRHIGFWSKNLTQRNVTYRIPVTLIRYAEPFHLNWVVVDGLTVGIEGQAEMRFVFRTAAIRDAALEHIKQSISFCQSGTIASPISSRAGSPEPEKASVTPTSHSPTRRRPPKSPERSATGIFAPLSRSLSAAVSAAAELPVNFQRRIPKVVNLPRDILITRASLHFVCLTIGSRGDVQPYIALGLGLRKEGHRVTIVTHEEYREWIVGFGLGHRTAGGDPGALMKLSVENKMFSPEFFRESLNNFRPWLDQLLVDAWKACSDADVLLESPSAMAGVHIAEALAIPYFRTFTMPWTKTSEFPHAFLSPPVESPTFNSASYILFSNVMWAATSGQINKWRRHTLRISHTNMGHLAQSKIMFIYNFSPVVVPKPLDWPDTTIVSGYWFLDNPDLDWKPPTELIDWMDESRKEGKPIVYIGFGSITVPHPNRVTAHIVKAVLQSGVRAVISKGWSTRMKSEDKDPEVEIPRECYLLDKVPHDWLFPRIDAAVHHGGAGTTGASLRAGIPTLIRPWFGDQFFWASRVQRLGAGLKVSLRVSDLSDALVKATTSQLMKERAASIGRRIREEDGVHTAIFTIYTYLHRASQDRAMLDKH